MSHSFIDYPSSGPDQGIVKDLTPAADPGTAADALQGSLKRLYAKSARGFTPGATLIVDQLHGDDISALREAVDRPFQTVTAALAAAQSGDLICVRPGNYVEELVLRDGINLHYDAGAIIDHPDYDDGKVFFSDGGLPVNCTISGNLIVRGHPDGDGPDFLVQLTAAGGVVHMSLRSFEFANVSQVAGVLHLTVDRYSGGCVLTNVDGEQNVAAAQGDANFFQTGADGQQRVYVNYFSNGDPSGGFVCDAGRQYIHAEATYAPAVCNGGFQSVNAIDINLNTGATAVICTGGIQRIQGGTIRAMANVPSVVVSGGNCGISVSTIEGGEGAETISISGGTLRITNSRVFGISASPVTKSGGTLILQNCVLAGGGPSIAAPTAQDVLIYGTVMANTAKSSNVTLKGNAAGLLVSGDVI